MPFFFLPQILSSRLWRGTRSAPETKIAKQEFADSLQQLLTPASAIEHLTSSVMGKVNLLCHVTFPVKTLVMHFTSTVLSGETPAGPGAIFFAASRHRCAASFPECAARRRSARLGAAGRHEPIPSSGVEKPGPHWQPLGGGLAGHPT